MRSASVKWRTLELPGWSLPRGRRGGGLESCWKSWDEVSSLAPWLLFPAVWLRLVLTAVIDGADWSEITDGLAQRSVQTAAWRKGCNYE